MKYLQPDHPYWRVRSLIEDESDVILLTFSYYTYIPKSLTDIRTEIPVRREDFLNQYFIEELLRETPSNQELALHSTILCKGALTLHLPMIDMSTGSSAQLEKVRPIIGQDLFEDFDWYKSGRSYHGYGRYFLSRNDWVVQMGKLLLVNQVGLPHTVDPRWVGHRLIAGYAALRWTKNTPHYMDYPRKALSRYQF